jgi:hypothetical protein
MISSFEIESQCRSLVLSIKFHITRLAYCEVGATLQVHNSNKANSKQGLGDPIIVI